MLDRALGKRKTAGTVARACGLAVALALLSACTPAQLGAIAGLSALSYIETDKTLSDHVASKIMGKDCASRYAFETGRLCKEETVTYVAQQAPTYCYRTLGNITCYSTPDPYDSRTQQVRWPREPESADRLAGREVENTGD